MYYIFSYLFPDHPLKEIRERSLQILLAKLQLGWEFEDELGATRELFEALLIWLEIHKPSIKREALELLLTIIKVFILINYFFI